MKKKFKMRGAWACVNRNEVQMETSLKPRNYHWKQSVKEMAMPRQSSKCVACTFVITRQFGSLYVMIQITFLVVIKLVSIVPHQLIEY